MHRCICCGDGAGRVHFVENSRCETRGVTHSLLWGGAMMTALKSLTLVARIDVKQRFGTSVRMWRTRLGISQEELAGRAGLHRTYVSDVERGARNVSLESIEKLAKALEVSVSTLFYRMSSPGTHGPEMTLLCADELVDILFVEDNEDDVQLTLRA